MEPSLSTTNIKKRFSQLYVPKLILNDEVSVPSFGLDVEDMNLLLSYCPQLSKIIQSPLSNHKTFSDDFGLFEIVSYSFLNTNYTNSVSESYSSIRKALSSLTDLFNLITGKSRMLTVKVELKKQHQALLKQISNYKDTWQNHRADICLNIDAINIIKKNFKEEVLIKVSNKIHDIGISGTVDAYEPVILEPETLKLNDELEYIKQEMEQCERNFNNCNSLIERLLLLSSPILLPLLYWQQVKEITAAINKYKHEIDLESKKVESNLKQITKIATAFKNIKNIFEDISYQFIPLILHIIDNFGVKYHNEKEVPTNVKMALHITCNILKMLAEKRILGDGKNINETVDNVVKYNNEVSLHYEDVKHKIKPLYSSK